MGKAAACGWPDKLPPLSHLPANGPIPIPQLEEQERIATILDQFDTLVNDLGIGLPAELKARRRPYAHYCGRLLSLREAA